MSDDDGPDETVSINIGICGIFIFTSLLLLCLLALWSSIQHKYSKLIFGFASLTCIFELPRCIALIVEEAYRDQVTYIFHMVANLFFFTSFTFVCLLLHEAVDISKSTSPLQSKFVYKKSRIESLLLTRNSLYTTNILFGIIIFITSIFCGLTSSLFDFFRYDSMYKVYTYFDIIKNLVYSIALLYFGCKLRSRIQGFSKQVTIHQDSSIQESLILHRLEFAVKKLIIVMMVCIVAFILRSITLILKVIYVEYERDNMPGDFQTYGMAWFWMSDYLPRLLPTLAFVYFLGNISSPRTLLMNKFRFFSKDSTVDIPHSTPNNIPDASNLSQSIASTLYEEEYSMNQMGPSLRDFFLNDAASSGKPGSKNARSIDSEEDSLTYGVGTGTGYAATNTSYMTPTREIRTPTTTGGGGRSSSLEPGALSSQRDSQTKNPDHPLASFVSTSSSLLPPSQQQRLSSFPHPLSAPIRNMSGSDDIPPALRSQSNVSVGSTSSTIANPLLPPEINSVQVNSEAESPTSSLADSDQPPLTSIRPKSVQSEISSLSGTAENRSQGQLRNRAETEGSTGFWG